MLWNIWTAVGAERPQEVLFLTGMVISARSRSVGRDSDPCTEIRLPARQQKHTLSAPARETVAGAGGPQRAALHYLSPAVVLDTKTPERCRPLIGPARNYSTAKII